MRRTDEGVHVSGRAHNNANARSHARTLPVFGTGGQEQEQGWCARAVWAGLTADNHTLEPAPTLLPVTLPLRLLLLLLLLLPPRRDREVLRPLRGMPEEDDGHWAP